MASAALLADAIARKHGIDPHAFRQVAMAHVAKPKAPKRARAPKRQTSGGGPEQQFAVSVLRGVGAPVTSASVRNMLGWMRAEGGHTHNDARFNFLNTTQPAPGAGNTGSQGNIKVYRDLAQGVQATVQTLRNGRYGAILQAFNADPSSFARAVNSSPWGTKSDFSGLIRGASAPASPGAGGAVPPTAAPALGAPAVQQVAGSLDAKRLMMLLGHQRERSLRGLMPAPGFQAELAKVAQQALPNAQVHVAGQNVGAEVAGAAGSLKGVTAAPALAVRSAAAQQGVDYSWGGGGPKGASKGIGRGAGTVGFDCSGLTEYAWAKAGVSIGGTTYEQIKAGVGVSPTNRSQWREGDLLFPHPGHVQLYAGNGMAWEAPFTGGKVRLVKVRASYQAVRRPA